MKKALLVIDIQNDYFEGGNFPLWNTEQVLDNILKTISIAKNKHIPVILIQHIADPSKGVALFFNKNSTGANIKSEVLNAVPEAKIVVKQHADSFYNTNLEDVLSNLGIDELLCCGMMSQNCVTHTAISKSAEKYKVSIINECCTSINEAIHRIGMNAISTRLNLVGIEQAFQ